MSYTWPMLIQQNYQVVGVDFQGFGKSPGQKFSSRTENHFIQNGSIEFLLQIMQHFKINKKQPCILVGYDWGASVALAFASKYGDLVQNVIAFHPSWTCDLNPLNQINCRCLLLWVPAEQLHAIQLGEKMNKAIKNCSLIKLKCGKFTSDKPMGLYSCLSDQICEQINNFLTKNQQQSKQIDYKQKQLNQQFQQNEVKQSNQIIQNDQIIHNEEEKNPNELQQQQQNQNKQEEITISKEQQQKIRLNLEDLLLNQNQYQIYFNENKNYSKQIQQQNQQQLLIEQEEERKQIFQKEIEFDSNIKDTIQINRWAVSKFKQLLQSGELEEYYKAYLNNTVNKPKAVKLFMSLPTLLPNTDLQKFIDFGIWSQIPKNHQIIEDFPEFLQGRQIIIKSKVLASIREQENYLTYDNKSEDELLTHRGKIVNYLASEQKFVVAIDLPQNLKKKDQEPQQQQFTLINIPCSDVYKWNRQTNFTKNQQKDVYYFEDQIKCKYNNALTKAKLLEAALSIKNLVGLLDFEKFKFSSNNKSEQQIQQQIYGSSHSIEAKQMSDIQQQCVVNILSVINLRHLVHEGIDPKRFTSTECGKLAYNGQGNCHALASTSCAFLLPFTKALGIEIRFRAGSVIMKQRDINPETLEINKDWDGKPRQSEDHTWAEITYYPTLQSKVIDMSSMFINYGLDQIYCHNIGFNVKDRRVCNSQDIKPPKNIFREGEKVEELKRVFVGQMFDLKPVKFMPINFANILLQD